MVSVKKITGNAIDGTSDLFNELVYRKPKQLKEELSEKILK